MNELQSEVEARIEQVDKQFFQDVFLVALVAGFLVAVHYGLPADIKALLAFDHEAFRPWTLLTSAFVHRNDVHLWNNVQGFLLASGLVYWLCWRLGKRSWFRWTLLAFLIVLPIIVNLTSYLVLGWLSPESTTTGRGFSSIAAGFVGFLFTAFLTWVADITSRNIALYVGQLVTVVLVWELSLIYKGFDVLVVVLIGFVFLLIGVGIFRETTPGQRQFDWQEQFPTLYFASLIVGLLAAFIVVLFPADFIGSEAFTNIFAHAAGLIYGAVMVYVPR